MSYVGPRLDHLPIVGVCGERGSGKTALISRLCARAQARGWMVLVVDRDRPSLSPGDGMEESDRLFASGVDVLCRDGQQMFVRAHGGDGVGIEVVLRRAAARYDLVLVEDHAVASLPTKIWLRRDADDAPPAIVGAVALDLAPGEDREERAFHLIERSLTALAENVPVYGVILLGERKPVLEQSLEKLIASVADVADGIVLAGPGRVPDRFASLPRLADVPGKSGPVAGMLAAMRWEPRARFVFLAGDMPDISAEMVKTLVSNLRAGVLGVMGQIAPHLPIELFPCVLDGRMGAELEYMNDPSSLVMSPGLRLLQIPPEWRHAFPSQVEEGAQRLSALG